MTKSIGYHYVLHSINNIKLRFPIINCLYSKISVKTTIISLLQDKSIFGMPSQFTSLELDKKMDQIKEHYFHEFRQFQCKNMCNNSLYKVGGYILSSKIFGSTIFFL